MKSDAEEKTMDRWVRFLDGLGCPVEIKPRLACGHGPIILHDVTFTPISDTEYSLGMPTEELKKFSEWLEEEERLARRIYV